MSALAVMMTAACGDDVDPNPNTPRPQQSQTEQGLSDSFQNVCAACHGEEGKGKNQYPSIPGRKDESAFIEIVRSGRGDMPASDASKITHAELKADYFWLTTKRQ